MERESIKILITGDVCPINRVEDLAINGKYSSIYNDFIDVFQENDLNVVDLECPLTLSKNERPKTGPYQKASPETIGVLKHAGIGLVAMANNHIMDYGSEGVEDTLTVCAQNNIRTFGIGNSIKEASEDYTFEIKEKRIAFLNFADNEFLSTPDGKYVCNAIDPIKSSYSIKAAKKNHDLVFAIVHAGNEFYELPSPRTKELYRYLIDQGADVVVAHHTHAHSGYEVYNSKPIFYGLGNFIYDWPSKQNERWNKGYVVRFDIDETINFTIIPLKQGNEIPGVFHLNDKEKKIFEDELERLNVIIQDDKLLEEAFQKYCRAINPMYDAFIEPYFGKYYTALRKRKLLPNIMTRKKRLLLLNIIRCESHRDVLLRMLKKYE